MCMLSELILMPEEKKIAYSLERLCYLNLDSVKSALPHTTSLRERRLPANLAKGVEVRGPKD